LSAPELSGLSVLDFMSAPSF